MKDVSNRAVRVAILRSSRFLPLAIDASRLRWPGADLRVVYQPGAEGEWRSRGLPEHAGLRYDEAPFITPSPFLGSRALRELRAWAPDVVAVQWSTPDGRGHWRLGLAALFIHARGFEAVTSDGAWISNDCLDAVFAPALRKMSSLKGAGARIWSSGAVPVTRAVVRSLLQPVERSRAFVAQLALILAVGSVSAFLTPAWIVQRALEAHRMGRRRH